MYPSFLKAKVIKEKGNCKKHEGGKSRGYGFVSFSNGLDMIKALKEKNGKYCGNRPMKISKGKHEDRSIKHVRKKERERKKARKVAGGGHFLF